MFINIFVSHGHLHWELQFFFLCHFLYFLSGSQARALEQRNRHQHSSLVSRVICCFPQSCSWIFWSKCGRFKSKDWKVFHESKIFSKLLISGIELTKGSKQNQKTFVNIAKGTTDPRVEFILPKSYRKFKRKSCSTFIFRILTKHLLEISTKHQHFHLT